MVVGFVSIYLIEKFVYILEAIFELPIRTISQVKQQGVFRKRLVITTGTLEEHVLRGSIKEAHRLYNWATFAIETVASGNE